MTDKSVGESNNSDQTDSDDDIEGNYKFKERELKESSSLFLIVMYSVEGQNISPSEIVNLAPRESQIPVSFTSGPNWEALAFPKYYSAGRNYFNEEGEVEFSGDMNVSSRWSIKNVKNIAGK